MYYILCTYVLYCYYYYYYKIITVYTTVEFSKLEIEGTEKKVRVIQEYY